MVSIISDEGGKLLGRATVHMLDVRWLAACVLSGSMNMESQQMRLAAPRQTYTGVG